MSEYFAGVGKRVRWFPDAAPLRDAPASGVDGAPMAVCFDTVAFASSECTSALPLPLLRCAMFEGCLDDAAAATRGGSTFPGTALCGVAGADARRSLVVRGAGVCLLPWTYASLQSS